MAASFTIGRGFLDLDVNDKGFRRSIKGTRRGLASLDKGLKATSRAARNLLIVGAAALTGAAIGLAKQEKAEAKLAAILKTTGNAAGFTSDQLIKEASALQELTAVSDDVIINMQAVLATFKAIKGDEFDRATRAILDMSIVLDQNLRTGAIQVGKALNDPIRGVTALRLVGVSLTQAQADLVKQFVETNQVAKAQGVILKELEGEFGGAAEAASKTLGGSLAKLKNTVSDLGESFAKIFEPAITGAAEGLRGLVPSVERFVAANEGLIESTAKVGTGIAFLLFIIPTIVNQFSDFKKAIKSVAAFLFRMVLALGTITAAVTVLIGALVLTPILIGISNAFDEAFSKNQLINKQNKAIESSAEVIQNVRKQLERLRKVQAESAGDPIEDQRRGVEIARVELRLAEELIKRRELMIDQSAQLAGFFGQAVGDQSKALTRLADEVNLRRRNLDLQQKSLQNMLNMEEAARRSVGLNKALSGLEASINEDRLKTLKITNEEGRRELEFQQKKEKGLQRILDFQRKLAAGGGDPLVIGQEIARATKSFLDRINLEEKARIKAATKTADMELRLGLANQAQLERIQIANDNTRFKKIARQSSDAEGNLQLIKEKFAKDNAALTRRLIGDALPDLPQALGAPRIVGLQAALRTIQETQKGPNPADQRKMMVDQLVMIAKNGQDFNARAAKVLGDERMAKQLAEELRGVGVLTAD